MRLDSACTLLMGKAEVVKVMQAHSFIQPVGVMDVSDQRFEVLFDHHVPAPLSVT